VNAVFVCARCGQTGRKRIPAPPFPDELGQRVRNEICLPCWEEWKRRQMLLINHYGLRVRDPAAREFLLVNLRSFLFGEGNGEAGIDTDLEGTVTW
jgi:Fe-S cluster biosynthesis and repair protein YggX